MWVRTENKRNAWGWEAECGESRAPLGSVVWPEVGEHFLFANQCSLCLYHDWVWAPRALGVLVRPLLIDYIWVFTRPAGLRGGEVALL